MEFSSSLGDGGSDDTLYAVLGTIIWEMLVSWGKLLH